ncbi:hypothetical protein QN277_019685 [Acacia crassicarpa]|uniref:CCHC-type domain-containing protein n=1 Tax=Acacia crassicarpa TaxID=499986 RepID=A0AAE1KDQ8_9FABA|nr:hypothetical protein QN277_019685 [Acacia crassicarpa]
MDDKDDGVEQDEEAVDVWRRTGQLPKLQVSAEEYEAWCKPYKNSLIVKLLGKSVNVGFMRLRLERMWARNGLLRVTPLNNGYFLVSFSSTEDREFALHEGPWMIADHYVLVQHWRPNFNPWKADSQKRVAVWVRVPDLPHELYNVESIRRIGNMIGRTLKIDRTTAFSKKGGFARLCVEVDLQKPLLSGFSHFGEERRFAYEGLHMVCFTCGRYGHRMTQCAVGNPEEDPVKRPPVAPTGATPSQTEGTVTEEVKMTTEGPEKVAVGGSDGIHQRVNYGPLMLVEREFRKNKIKGNQKVTKTDVGLKKAGNESGGSYGLQQSGDTGIKEKNQALNKEKNQALMKSSVVVDTDRRFGDEVKNMAGNQEWTLVGSKRKAGVKIKSRGKENKFGDHNKVNEKGKGVKLGPKKEEPRFGPCPMHSQIGPSTGLTSGENSGIQGGTLEVPSAIMSGDKEKCSHKTDVSPTGLEGA